MIPKTSSWCFVLIDITCCPLVLLPDECPTTIVLRTISAKGVSGRIQQDSGPRFSEVVSPNESLVRSSATYHETILPLFGAICQSNLAVLFEAASALANGLDQNPVAAWRIQLSVIYKHATRFWHVTVLDLTRNTPLLTLATKEIAVGAFWPKLPLARLREQRKTAGIENAPATIWARLLDDD
jgi:hypothetical protein